MVGILTVANCQQNCTRETRENQTASYPALAVPVAARFVDCFGGTAAVDGVTSSPRMAGRLSSPRRADCVAALGDDVDDSGGGSTPFLLQ